MIIYKFFNISFKQFKYKYIMFSKHLQNCIMYLYYAQFNIIIYWFFCKISLDFLRISNIIYHYLSLRQNYARKIVQNVKAYHRNKKWKIIIFLNLKYYLSLSFIIFLKWFNYITFTFKYTWAWLFIFLIHAILPPE